MAASKGVAAVTNPIYDEEDEAENQRRSDECYFDDLLRSGRMDTIYESCEEFVDSSDERSNETSSNIYSSDETSSGRGSADSLTGVLRRSVRAWCDATGLPTTVVVETKSGSFRLHKLPLVSRSGYFRRILSASPCVKLPADFPGGMEMFQAVANYCYDSTIHIDSSNVAALRCAAEFLEMTEEYGNDNLCKLTESYLARVAFRSSRDAILVLERSQELMPLAEEVLVVSRSIEALADAACLEVQRRGERFSGSFVRDLLELLPGFFVRFVSALRRKGMEERHVGQVIIEFARIWLLDFESTRDGDKETTNRVFLLEATVRLLPLERFVMPLDILFSLHGRAIAWGASNECRVQVEIRIASQLELATIEDLRMSMRAFRGNRVSRSHMDSMHQIVAVFMSDQQVLTDNKVGALAECELKSTPSYSFLAVSAVAKVWDEYLTEIASDPTLSPRMFAELMDAVPTHIRTSHDQLYKAINFYLKLHNTISASDRLLVSKALNCQKLSQEVCVHAVQNEHMPLRMIVQAMFMQQLQSRHPRGEVTSYQVEQKQDDGMPLGSVLQKDSAYREAAYLKDDFRATKARLRELEQELIRMKKNMQDAERKHDGKGRKKFGGSCICQVLGFQANGVRLGQRISRTFQRLGLGSFWKARPYYDGTNNGPSYEQQREEQDAMGTINSMRYSAPVRASSFRRTESDRSSIRHSRHHSFS